MRSDGVVDAVASSHSEAELLPGIFASVLIYVFSVALHLLLPGRTFEGYACKDDEPSVVLRYKLNGALVAATLVVLAFFGCRFASDVEEREPWYAPLAHFQGGHYIGFVLGSNACAIASSVYFYVRGRIWYRETALVDAPSRAVTKDQTEERKKRKDDETPATSHLQKAPGSFWSGTGEFNPRSDIFGRSLDFKMSLYLAASSMLQISVLSMVAAHALANGGKVARAMGVGSICWSWCMFDYLLNEHVMLYSHDMFAERVGFKLAWGCLGFYPFFYPMGLRCLVREIRPEDDLSRVASGATFLLFFFGWILQRGANNQKYQFKVDPRKKRFLWVEQRALEVDDGSTQLRRILVSGWWGSARHLNYFGDILQGISFALPGYVATASLVPLLYPVLIASILIPRQVVDEKLCREKYGDDAWDEYCELVQWRIVPFLY